MFKRKIYRMPTKKKKRPQRKKRGQEEKVSRPLERKESVGQEYAFIAKTLGGRTFTAECFDGNVRIAIVRTKRMRISDGDIVLVGLRDFDNRRADILWKYAPDEVRTLEKEGELPVGSYSKTSESNVFSNDKLAYDGDDALGGFDFEDI